MRIALCFNLRHVKPDINNPQYVLEAEFDEPRTIRGIRQALEKLGHTVFLVEADENAYLKFKKLKNKLDLVFNIAEGIYGYDREAQLPAMLEMLRLPYTGPSPLAYALALDKIKAKEILSFHGIPTPAWAAVSHVRDLSAVALKAYPLIAKPAAEGSSKGIRAKNFASDFTALKKITNALLREFKSPVLIEEFLPGREFTVALIGSPPRVLPLIEVTFNELPDDLPPFDHYEAKWLYDNPSRGADPLICPARVSRSLRDKIEENCLRAFAALKMADWARVDVRLDNQGVPNILELNCPPGIIPDPRENSRFPRAARTAGLSYEQMLETILKSACRRHGLVYRK